MEKPNHERKSRGFREKLQQSAKNITSGERKAKSPKTPAQKRATRRKVWGVIGTICLVGVLTIMIFVGIFMYYVNKTMKGSIEVPMSEYKPAVSTEMYYDKNAGTGENEDWYMYQTLYYEQNRIWVDLGQIPDYLQQAAIAIEDKRFESHHGVDWYGTMRAIVRTLTGGSMQGGSTITQQAIKNITGDNQDNVKRKIMEIYRALALEKEYSKDDILEVYLNTIYLGEMCYGVQTASQAYFGKDAADLTLAESACLIGITNNPSMYDPLLSDWTRENNRDRQLTILKAMLDQNKISSEEYEAAKNEEVVFTDGYTCLGNYVEDHPEALSPEEQEKVSTANNSFYTDQVIEDVADAFVELYNLQDDPADQENGRSAHSKAVSMIYSGGYKIYTAQNVTLQQKVEAIYEDSSNLPYTRTTNGETEQLQSGVTIVDPKTGIFARKSYEYRLLADGATVASGEFTPKNNNGDVIPNAGMESWSTKSMKKMFSGSANVPYPNAYMTSSGTDKLCTQATYPGMVGDYCAQLAAKYAVIAFAAGNLYTGDFVMDGTVGYAQFGQPYTYSARPAALKLKYAAEIGEINRVKNDPPVSTGIDKGRIFVCIVEWSDRHAVQSGTTVDKTTFWDPETVSSLNEGKIIGYGPAYITESHTGSMKDLALPIVYYEKTDTPPTGNYTLVISTATSYLGDYLTGCDANKLWVDDFEWVYRSPDNKPEGPAAFTPDLPAPAGRFFVDFHRLAILPQSIPVPQGKHAFS